ncbi:MAG: hypothetical protein ACT4PI_03340 [Actinomycetota bacterium]
MIVPLHPGTHPRLASDHAGPVLEPPGLLALNFGTETPAVAIAAHIA